MCALGTQSAYGYLHITNPQYSHAVDCNIWILLTAIIHAATIMTERLYHSANTFLVLFLITPYVMCASWL